MTTRTPDLQPGPTEAAWRARLRRNLASWFNRHARDLPWRREPTGYRVWVSEIMLQQTTVAAVVPYFERFMRRFPDVARLAAASTDEVLRLWEGLGYYRRARQLHAAAQAIVAEHGGRFPDEVEAIRRLPGVGRYTAGAIASIAFDLREPILEANTLRVYSRLLALEGDPRSASGQRQLWDAARSWLPRRGVGQFNQALMELGATLCTPRAPRCDVCPVAALCQARTLGRQESIPPPARKPAIEEVREAAVVVRHASRVLVVRHGKGERWAGLWDFVRLTLGKQDTVRDGDGSCPAELAPGVERLTGLSIASPRRLTTLRHQVTRFRIELAVFEAARRGGHLERKIEARFVTPAELAELPLSTTGRKIARLLAE